MRENRFAAAAFNTLFKKSKKPDPSLQEKLTAGIPVAPDADPNSVPWGQMLPTKIEANLPPYPTGSLLSLLRSITSHCQSVHLVRHLLKSSQMLFFTTLQAFVQFYKFH